MGIMDNLKDKVTGATGVSGQTLTMLNEVVSESGGVSGLLEKFNAAGFGDIVKSWVGKEANLSITAEQIQKVLGSVQIQSLASKYGMDTNQVATLMANGLPKLINKISPDGKVPVLRDLASKFTDLKDMFS